MTAEGLAAGERERAASARIPRPARQAPADLTITFVDEASVRAHGVEAGEPDWLLADRLEGLAAYEALPMETNRLYTSYVDLRTAHLSNVRPASRAAAAATPTIVGKVPVGAAGLAETGNDGPISLVLSREARAAGVILETLADLGRRYPGELRRLLEGGCTLPKDDKLAQLTRAAWTDGIHIHVPDGARLEQPIVIRWSVGRPGAALLSRTIIDVGADAEVSILEEQLCADGVSVDDPEQGLFAGTTEVELGPGSSLSFAGLQDLPLREIAFQHRSAVVAKGSTLRWALAHLGSRVVRSRIDNRLEGDGSSVEQAEIVFGSSDQLFDLTSYTRHLGRDTTGNLLSKGALADSSRAYMKGLATIDETAHGTDSFLGEFGMLLSRQARSVAIPSLEIDQPDCRRVAHASSVGPIDEGQVFYLQSRGLERDEARKSIVMGYLEPVVARVPLASARDRLRDLLEAKWDARQAGVPAGA